MPGLLEYEGVTGIGVHAGRFGRLTPGTGMSELLRRGGSIPATAVLSASPSPPTSLVASGSSGAAAGFWSAFGFTAAPPAFGAAVSAAGATCAGGVAFAVGVAVAA